MKCIYCKCSLGSSGDEGSSQSREHIIQEAIGGNNVTVTNDCCRNCNSKLGTKVDAPFVDSDLIAMLRMQYEIPTKKGKPPTFSFSAKSSTNLKDTNVIFKTGPKLEIEIKPIVFRNMDGSAINVSASPQRAKEIWTGILQKETTIGNVLRSQSGEIHSSVDDIMASGVIETIGEVKGELLLNFETLSRGMAKIAFGFAHLVLGESWTFSESAEFLRMSAIGDGDFQNEILPKIKNIPGSRSIFIDEASDSERHHLIAILPYKKQTHILVSLFGGSLGNYVFEAGDFDDVYYKTLVEKTAFHLDPKTKKSTWLSLHSVVKKM